MIYIENNDLKNAIENSTESEIRIIGKSEGSRTVLKKLLNGDPSFAVNAAHKITDYLGFDIKIQFIKRGDSNVSAN